MWWCYMFCFLCALSSSYPLSLNKDDLKISEESFHGPAGYVKREILPCEDCDDGLLFLKSTSRQTTICNKHHESGFFTLNTEANWRNGYANSSCGERNEASRVVGGVDSNPNAFPWLGRLVYEKAFGCAASLINDRFVISAAHCVKGFMWFLYRVKFGEHDRCDKTQTAETRFVIKMIVNTFSLSDLSNDIALLMVNKPIEYTHAIKPVCLPKNDDNFYNGTTAIVAGWGAMNETGKWSCTVMEAELPVLSNEACRNTKYNASKIKDVMMCAGFPETAHKDACTGDSGGPLVLENEEHMYDLIGVVSWGYGCARKGYPGVYTRVTKYLDWIRDNTQEGCYCKY